MTVVGWYPLRQGRAHRDTVRERMRIVRRCGGLLVCVFMGAARIGVAQRPPRDTSYGNPESASLGLPLLRRLTQPPNVADVGNFETPDGGSSTGHVNAALAVEDLREYAGQLRTLFPWSTNYYPADSLAAVQRARAAAWLVRLRALPGTNVAGAQQIALAMVAFQAEQDSLARRAIETRLARTTTPLERSLDLAAGVVLFADPEQRGERLARNFPLAEVYAAQLKGVPATGYASQIDSLYVAQRKFLAVQTTLRAAGALPGDQLLAYVSRFWSTASVLSQRERHDLVTGDFPYAAVASAFHHRANGQAEIDSLDARLVRYAQYRAREWTPGTSPADRQTTQARERSDVREGFAALALIGHPAPPIVAHAWLHTADSAYVPTPRAHPLNDGLVRVIAFRDRTDPLLSALDRVQRHFPAGVQIVLVTETEGHVGPDLSSPADEVAWLNRFYAEKRHLIFPVAVWAGEKVAQETSSQPSIRIVSSLGTPVQGTVLVRDSHGGMREIQSEGIAIHYQRYLPARSPNPTAYRVAAARGDLIILDGHGLIQAYQPLQTRADEAQLVRLLTTLRAHEDSASAGRLP